MALTTRKKNLIIAEWKTGKYKSFYAIAKAHKINVKTAKKILAEIPHENSDIVEVGVVYESAKKSTKNPLEIKAVENAVLERIKVQDISNKILDKISSFVDGGKAQKVVTTGSGDGISVPEVVEYDLQADDYKKLSEAVDKISVTTGVNPRFAPPSKVENNINNNQQTNIQEIGVTFLDEDEDENT